MTEVFLSLMQEMQKPGSVDMRALRYKITPNIKEEEQQTEKIVIDYLTHQKTLIEQQYNSVPIFSDADDIGKLKNIAEAFKEINAI